MGYTVEGHLQLGGLEWVLEQKCLLQKWHLRLLLTLQLLSPLKQRH